jgi:hypothetical protein
MSTIDEARRELHAFIDDMDSLKVYADPGNPEAAPFNSAFAMAREKAKLAAETYIKALKA